MIIDEEYEVTRDDWGDSLETGFIRLDLALPNYDLRDKLDWTDNLASASYYWMGTIRLEKEDNEDNKDNKLVFTDTNRLDV